MCDSDHNDPHCKGGPTALHNMTPLCRPHNNLKHQDGWSLAFDSDTGEATWTSADGTKVITLPAPDI